jgi:alpha-L-rhamnosidase
MGLPALRTDRFSCSDARLNALHGATVQSFRRNACDIPTDCPTRERAGWTGDRHLDVAYDLLLQTPTPS